jgi:hypothetical protein
MSYYWFRGDYSISLDDPGYGTLDVNRDGTQWRIRLTGKRLGRFLSALTSRALGAENDDEAQWLLPQWLTVADARVLLPALQLAVIAAAAGSDKFERLYPDAEGPPQSPICVNCGAGSFTYSEIETFCGACLENGHTPFGSDATWDEADHRYEIEWASWSRQHPIA